MAAAGATAAPGAPAASGRPPRRPADSRASASPAGIPTLSLSEALAGLRAYVAPERRRVLTASLLLLLAGAIGLLQPLVVQRVLGGADPMRGAGVFVALLMGLVILGAGVSAYGNYQLTAAAEGAVLTARRRLTGHILRLPMADFRRRTPGDLMARVTGDTTLLRQVVLQTLVQAATSVVTAIGALVLMACLDLVLLGASVLAILLLLGLVGLVMPRIRDASLGAQNAIGEMGSVLDRALSAFTTVKACGTEQFEAERVGAAAEDAYRHGVNRARWDSVATATAALAVHLVFLVVLGVGGLRVADGTISVATLVAFLLYVLFLAQPVMALVAVGASFQTGRAAMQRIGDVLRLPIEPPRATDASREMPAAGPAAVDTEELRFDRVSFTYPGAPAPALRSFTLTVPAVGLTALVGTSGAGKSTALGLIERFHDPDAGAIRLDGVDLRCWDLHELRAAIGYVEQDAPVMAGSLRENLVYAAEGDVTDAELRRALEATRLQPLLHRLGDDLDAPIQYRGVSLSGGERQRVAIARALLRRPRLLLLDEATSQLDAVNEAALRDVIHELSGRTAVLAVAHRLSTVRRADRIAVVHAGTVQAIGTHEELLRGDPLYARLAAHQLLPDEGGSARRG
ncbi:ABC transporter ATP-binding protein [Streptomyces tritici]|uniref:ABC transporter ATP-binding protein n=1 Tax=Streptomyces tritici TaxID=2054410 RepID=UPI003AF0B610